MDDGAVLKAAHHVYNGVHLPDVRQKFIAQPLSLGGAPHQPGNVHEFQHGGGEFGRMVHLVELIQALVRNGYHAHVGLNGAEGIVGAFRARIGQGVEQGAFPHIRQAHHS